MLSALEEGLPESVLVVLPEPVWEFSELGLVVLPVSVPEPVFYKPPSDVLVAEFVSFELKLELLLVFVRSGDSYSSGF